MSIIVIDDYAEIVPSGILSPVQSSDCAAEMKFLNTSCICGAQGGTGVFGNTAGVELN